MGLEVAIIIERANVTLGGAERSVAELAAALAENGTTVTVLAAKGPVRSENVQILCRDHPAERVPLGTFASAVRKHLARSRYDIIHSVLPFDFADVYQPRGGTYIEAARRNAASYSNSLVRRYKDLTSFLNRRRTALLRAERSLCSLRHGPIIAALSKYVVEQLRNHYGTDSERIVLIPNGVKTDFTVDHEELRNMRARVLDGLGLQGTDNAAFFLFVANNFRLKGLVPLLKALHLANARPTPRKPYLIIAGHDEPGRYRRLAERLGLLGQVLFLGPLAEVYTALAVADVAVLPTFYDPSSRFILEAIAAGKPSITSRFNGAAEFIEHFEHGTIVSEPADLEALARAIVHFTDPHNRHQAELAIARDNLKEEVSIRRAAARLASLYDSILQRKTSR